MNTSTMKRLKELEEKTNYAPGLPHTAFLTDDRKYDIGEGRPPMTSEEWEKYLSQWPPSIPGIVITCNARTQGGETEAQE